MNLQWIGYGIYLFDLKTVTDQGLLHIEYSIHTLILTIYVAHELALQEQCAKVSSVILLYSLVWLL